MEKKPPNCSSKNPYSWRNPLLARRWKYVQALHRDYGVARTYANDFELGILVPDLLGRASSMKNLFEKMKATCRDEEVALIMAQALQTVVPALAVNAENPLETARQYLAEVEKVIDTEFLKPLDEANAAASVTDVETLTSFLQKMLYISESILVGKDSLFYFRFYARLFFKNAATGETIVWPPAHHEIGLSFFRIYLDELVLTAGGIKGTIESWERAMGDARKPFLEFLAAHMSARTSRLTIAIQLLAIALTFSFSAFFLTARDPFSLWRENTRLKNQLRELQNRSSAVVPVAAPNTGIDGGAR